MTNCCMQIQDLFLSPPVWAAGSTGSTGSAAVLFRRRELSNKEVYQWRRRMCWVTAGLRGGPSRDSFPSWTSSCLSHQMAAQDRLYSPWSCRCVCCPSARGDGWWRDIGAEPEPVKELLSGQSRVLLWDSWQPAWSQRTSGCWIHPPADKAGAYPECYE